MHQGTKFRDSTPQDLALCRPTRDKRVCVNTDGSLSGDVLTEFAPQATKVVEESYSACIERLRKKEVDAFSTDQAMLYGYADAYPDLRVVDGLDVGNDIGYGIAFRKQDHALCLRTRDALKTIINNQQWTAYMQSQLPGYLKAVPQHQTRLMPSTADLDADSCKDV